jgi:hypothetical protein
MSAGYCIAEVYMTFLHCVQKRRGMTFLCNLIDLIHVSYFLFCHIVLVSVKMCVSLIYDNAWWRFSGPFLKLVVLVMIWWVQQQCCILKNCTDRTLAEDGQLISDMIQRLAWYLIHGCLLQRFLSISTSRIMRCGCDLSMPIY